MGLQETKHFGNNNTSYVDAYDDIQLIKYGGCSKGIGYYRKNPLAYSGCHSPLQKRERTGASFLY